ncbi:hypothetical protein [Catenibacterium mitsuokai]|uniref:hypothetical protein n=1 Tax=Catenibacterium mitsuokai TaxID=100886 RepID=UPI003D07ECA4
MTKKKKSYDVTHAGDVIKLFKDIIPEDDTESVVRVQLYRNFRVAKINRPGYERLMRDAAKRVDKNYPTLTGVKRQREIMDACHDIIYDITFADLIIKDDGNYSTPWSKLDHPTLAAWGKNPSPWRKI